jgi:hypothetical protein
MNKIYDFVEIEKIRSMMGKLIFKYVMFAICFVATITFACLLIKNNLLLTLIFAFLLLIFILASVLFWKIKYGILKSHRAFLENMELGKNDNFVGDFVKCEKNENEDDPFDAYIFASNGVRVKFLIHNKYAVCFTEGKRYHIEHIGNYVNQWEIID